MGGIKGYLELNDLEKNEVYKFENRNGKIDKSIDEIFNNKINGYGNGSLFYFEGVKVLGKISVVLEVCDILGSAYIYSLNILESIEEAKCIIETLINGAIDICKKYNSKNIYLGIGNKEILNITEELGYKYEYVSSKMSLEDRLVKLDTLDLISLNNENKHTYLKIINKSFSDMPHGTYHYISDVDKYINIANDDYNFFMVFKDNNIIGFMNVEIEKGNGIFDIGLCGEYRGKGYGKELLETAIDFLNKKSVGKIELLVIQKNYRAYRMYKNRGFKDEGILNYWMEI